MSEHAEQVALISWWALAHFGLNNNGFMLLSSIVLTEAVVAVMIFLADF